MCVSGATRIVYSNKAMLEYLGYGASGGFQGPTLAELSDVIIHPDDRARTRDAFGVLFGRLREASPPEPTPVVRVDNVRLRRKSDGALRYCDMHGVLVLHDGEPALVTYLHDHSEQQALAARMRVAEHMASLGTLAAGVGHEINNPLTYVIANVELVAGRIRAERARLLVVDDELALLKAVHRILAGEYDVTVASSAREALELLSLGDSYHLILCDLMMPDMAGGELYAKLQAESVEAAGRFAFMTGGAVSAAGRGALQTTSIETLRKPFSPQELLSFVRRHVGVPGVVKLRTPPV